MAGTTTNTHEQPTFTMTNLRPDLYEVLGVLPTATQEEIGQAYRALLRRHHPDTRASVDQAQEARSDATLQDVLTAYAVLHDPDRRLDYDRQIRRASPAQRTTHRHPARVGTRNRPPIVAGPVRWHPS